MGPRRYEKLKDMRILFVADGRSAIAMNWIHHWVERGDEVFLASTFKCSPKFPLRGLFHVPVAFSSVRTSAASARLRSVRHIGLRTVARQWLGPLTIRRAARRLREVIRRVQPDLVHAMRIPYEGMLVAEARAAMPLVVSVWGNDFTLHAPSTPLMRYYTRRTLQVTDALHADCARDVRLAYDWGFPRHRSTLVIPGSGGILSDVFHPPVKPSREPVVINPRGFRDYVRNDTFFRAIPLVLARNPDARFICVAMAGEAQAIERVRALQIGHAVDLLPSLQHAEMAGVYRRAQVLVSPSMHDGTPNTLLEGMACGCFPVVSDLESIREWVTSGMNGLLVDPTSPERLAAAIIEALENHALRETATGRNVELIASQAEYGRCMQRAAGFYRTTLDRSTELPRACLW